MPIKSLQIASKTLLTTYKKLAHSFYSPSAKNCFSTSMPAYNLLSITLCESKACKLLQFTSVKTCEPMLIHKCKTKDNKQLQFTNIKTNCCQFTNANTLQTVANSQVPIPCILLPICKCKYLANFCQFTSTHTLQIVASLPVPKPCKLLPICNRQTRACTLLQFTSAKTLQNAQQKLANSFNSPMPIPCNPSPLH